MSKPSIQTLALLSSSELQADKKDLARLQRGVVEQMKLMSRLREEEALRGLLVGMQLVRIKHSMPHGTFGPWVKKNIQFYGERYANYLMRLAMAFVDKARVAKPELLALPGDQTELAIDGMAGAQKRFVEKARKFVGDLCLHELLIKHNIKAVGIKTELTAGEEEPLSADQKSQQAKDQIFQEAWNSTQLLRQALTEQEKISRLNDPKKIQQLKAEVVEINHLLDERLAALRAVSV